MIALVAGLVVLPVCNAFAAQYKVGFCVMTLAFTWMTYSYQALIDEAAKYPEIELIVDNAGGDVSKQVEIIENFIAQGVDAIITDPIDVNTLIPIMEDAEAKGIAFATFDRRAFGGPFLFHVGCNDVFGGRLALEYCAAKLDGVGKIIHIVGQWGLRRRSTARRAFMNSWFTIPDWSSSTSRAVSSAAKRVCA
jgi:ABC-type sugar transport system substrate-binding protein